MSNIPSNEQIRTALDNAYAYAKTVQGGKNASYIPALAQVPSDLLAIAVVTVNGDLLTAGSADAPFAIESISKAFNLAYVMDLIGMKQLRAKIGADPTGEPFNSVMAIELHGGKPLNPLVNAGAMATVSLVNGSDSDEIWGNMIHNFNNFANTALTVNQEIYKSESATNQHNRGIAWLLAEDILDFHVKFERIHPFQDGNGRVGRLIMFKECLKYNIVPFIIEDNLKMFYYRGLKEWDNEKGYLTDTCLTAQDKYKAYLDYFRIGY